MGKMMDKDSFAYWLQKTRFEQKLSRDVVADHVGFGVRRYELGKPITLERAEILAAYYGSTLWKILKELSERQSGSVRAP